MKKGFQIPKVIKAGFLILAFLMVLQTPTFDASWLDIGKWFLRECVCVPVLLFAICLFEGAFD